MLRTHVLAEGRLVLETDDAIGGRTGQAAFEAQPFVLLSSFEAVELLAAVAAHVAFFFKKKQS